MSVAEAQFCYLRDPVEITRRSFAMIEDACDFSRFPLDIAAIARRLVHTRGDGSVLDRLAWSQDAGTRGAAALREGGAILCDSAMTAAGIDRSSLPAGNDLLCYLGDPGIARHARTHGMTRSAAAVERWPPRLGGGVAVVGNAPTALFRLLELLPTVQEKPALVIGMPVGFVGAAEAKQALIDTAPALGISYVTLTGRDGGSALAASAVNAVARFVAALS